MEILLSPKSIDSLGISREIPLETDGCTTIDPVVASENMSLEIEASMLDMMDLVMNSEAISE